MKKIKEFFDRMDEKFEKTDWTFMWNIIFPFFSFSKKKQITSNSSIIQIPTQTLRFRVQRDISQFQNIYGNSTDIGMSMEMIKAAMAKELMDQIIKSNAIEFKSYKQMYNGTGGMAGIQDPSVIEAEILVIKK